MGAVTFSLDTRLLDALREALPLEVFVETGTFKGDGAAAAAARFSRVITVESSESLWQEVKARFAAEPRVDARLGDSGDFLREVAPGLRGTATLFWLDAHWCVATGTAGEKSQCPLLAEIEAIGSLAPASVVLVDDARLFLATPPEPHDVTQWPSFDEVTRALRRLSDRHELAVVNDVIAFFPPEARDAVQGFARKAGVDWLRSRQALDENGFLRASLEEKEALIREQESTLAQRERVLLEKESMIATLAGELHASSSFIGLAWRKTRGLIRFVSETGVRMVSSRIRPRLGNLRQHEPVAIDLVTDRSPVALPPSPPRIALVTPSFGQAAFIGRTIESVLAQGYPNLDYFVQDGGSTDGTVEILERYAPRLSGWVSEKDTGQSQAINRGFARVTGEIMGWLNSDDVLLPGALAAVADFFHRHPDVDAVYGHRLLLDEQDRLIGRWIVPEHDDKVLPWADYVPQETLFWRRALWDKAGGAIDESFRFAMDWDLLLRFRKAGARFARIDRALGGFRVHPQQKTSAAINEVGFAEMQKLRHRELGFTPGGTDVARRVLPYLIAHVRADRAWAAQNPTPAAGV